MLVWDVDNPAAAMARELLMAEVATTKFLPTVAMIGGHLKEATNNRKSILTALLHLVVFLMAATTNGVHTLLKGKIMAIKPAGTESHSPATDK